MIKKYLSHTLLAIWLLTLTACQPAPQEYRTTFLSWGTLIDISFWGIEKDKAESVIKEVEKDLNYMHYAWHAWQPGPIGRINMLLQTTGSFSANPSVLGPISKARELAIVSDHLFNPAISELIKLWGFHDDLPKGPPPSPKSIKQQLIKNPRMDDITIDHVRMKSKNPHVRIDLGGIAKGYGIEQIIKLLKNHGIRDAIINAGGDLKAIGQHGDRPWKIGVRNPHDKQKVIASLSVKDGESVFTSGNYERFYEHEGKRYHHIIDPRTGYPALGTSSVTLIHSDAATADAAATALFVAGPKDWQRIARQMGIEAVLLIDDVGNYHVTEMMKNRLVFTEPPTSLKVYALK
ncbi:MAG: FAD:protein FMN transferase [Gammaproteobacteria bacterium]|nr:FAD:protein FMN transferase [Gammaproteobacteria bacterium]